MGKVIAHQVCLKNNMDVVRAIDGTIAEDEIRTLTLDMVVDTGARAVGLLESLIQPLGLPQVRHVSVNLAEGSQRLVPMYGQLKIEIIDTFGNTREGVFHCLGKPEKAPCILGQIVLEDMDFVVDCPNQRLIPNPEAPAGSMLYEDF